MKIFDGVSKKTIKKTNLNWPQISYRLYRILIIGSSGCGKTTLLFNLINQ